MWPKITDTEYEPYKKQQTPVYAAYSNNANLMSIGPCIVMLFL